MPPRVLLTGASGFIGSHLARHLVDQGYPVTVLVRDRSHLGFVDNAPQLKILPVTDTWDSIKDAVATAQPEMIVHLASLFLSEHQSQDVESLVRSNVLFGAWLLQAAAEVSVKAFVNAGTSWQHYSGDDVRPVNLYAATKQAFEALLDYYCDAAGMSAITLKLFDTYGPEDRRRKLIPLLVDALRDGNKLALSEGDQRLDLLHIHDVCTAFERAAQMVMEMPKQHVSYTLRTSTRPTLKELVSLLSDVSGRPSPAEFGKRPYRAREIMVPWTGGAPLPGWSPRRELREGLREVWAEGGPAENCA